MGEEPGLGGLATGECGGRAPGPEDRRKGPGRLRVSVADFGRDERKRFGQEAVAGEAAKVGDVGEELERRVGGRLEAVLVERMGEGVGEEHVRPGNEEVRLARVERRGEAPGDDRLEARLRLVRGRPDPGDRPVQLEHPGLRVEQRAVLVVVGRGPGDADAGADELAPEPRCVGVGDEDVGVGCAPFGRPADPREAEGRVLQGDDADAAPGGDVPDEAGEGDEPRGDEGRLPILVEGFRRCGGADLGREARGTETMDDPREEPEASGDRRRGGAVERSGRLSFPTIEGALEHPGHLACQREAGRRSADAPRALASRRHRGEAIAAGASIPAVAARPEPATLPGRRPVSLSRVETASLLRDLTSRGVSVTLTVGGSSMHPALRSGDVVTLAPAKGRTLPVGAVVAAEDPGGAGLVVHRVVGRSADGLLLRGDNAERADGTVAEAAVLGVVVRVERNGRHVRQGPSSLRRPFATLVRAGVVWRLNRLKGQARAFVPSAILAWRGRQR